MLYIVKIDFKEFTFTDARQAMTFAETAALRANSLVSAISIELKIPDAQPEEEGE